MLLLLVIVIQLMKMSTLRCLLMRISSLMTGHLRKSASQSPQTVTVRLVIEIQQRPVNSSSIYEDIPGFAYEAGESYIYPTNYPIRDYQFNIVSKCLLRNTLVSLPTGLGKTFIAAVVMYNYYRWYPFKKVIFLAPTKPLVSQQVEACYNVMGMLLLGKS